MLVSWSIGCRGQTAQAGPMVREPAVAGGEPVPPGIDITKPNIARVYDSFLDGKDNISQVVPAVPYNGVTMAVQARHANYSKIASSAVRMCPVPVWVLMCVLSGGRS